MEFIQYKIFIEPSNGGLVTVEVPKEDYYAFVRLYIDKGYSQIVVPSNVMIMLLKHYFVNKKAKIVDIDFLEDDDEYKKQFDEIIEKVNSNRDYFIDLMEELDFLSYQKTVEIKHLRINYRSNGSSFDIKLSLNGLLTIGGKGELENELSSLNSFIWEKIKLWV